MISRLLRILNLKMAATSMSYSFTFDSDSLAEIRDLESCVRLEVEFSLRIRDLDDVEIDSITLFDPSTGLYVDFETLSKSEQDKIEKRCYEIGYESAAEELACRAEARAEAMEDR